MLEFVFASQSSIAVQRFTLFFFSSFSFCFSVVDLLVLRECQVVYVRHVAFLARKMQLIIHFESVGRVLRRDLPLVDAHRTDSFEPELCTSLIILDPTVDLLAKTIKHKMSGVRHILLS